MLVDCNFVSLWHFEGQDNKLLWWESASPAQPSINITNYRGSGKFCILIFHSCKMLKCEHHSREYLHFPTASGAAGKPVNSTSYTRSKTHSFFETLEMFAILISCCPRIISALLMIATSLMMEPNTIIVMESQCNWWNSLLALKCCSLDDKDSILTGWFIFAADWSHSTHEEKGLRRGSVSFLNRIP